MNPDDRSATQRQLNLWAPWRMEYIDSLGGQEQGCFLCHHGGDAQQDRPNLVFWRGRQCFAVLNRFPYTGGHSLVAPYEHLAGLEHLSPATMLEIMRMVRDLQKALAEAVKAQGFNIGMNVGRCAGAGLPGHLHVHIVPRWPGDTNFIGVLSGARVIPTTLEQLYDEILKVSRELNLPCLED
jgi:ATP adenylyltransferase